MSYNLIGELAATGLQLGGVSPLISNAVRRLLPSIIEYTEKAIERGADPEAELQLMMEAAEEQARTAEIAKFGPG